jgi:DNA-binding NarL/FixJ family response regulator
MDKAVPILEEELAVVTVLLVDDHAIWRGAVKSMLQDTEFQVVAETASGNEALEVARRVCPQLTLLDIRMAGGDGLETLLALKNEHPQMSVVMLTTYDNPVFMKRALAGGANGYLVKGIDRDHLIATLRAASQCETQPGA